MYQRREITPEELSVQHGFCEKIKESLGGERRLAFVDTYGCQQNESDSEALRGWLAEAGFGITDDPMQAHVIAVNTCAVREHAEMRAMGNVGALVHAKEKNPDLIVCVGGCMAQQERMRIRLQESFRMVDLVFGPHELWRFPELLWQTMQRHGRRGNKGRLFMAEPSEGVIAENLPRRRDSGLKAWLSIMNGCDNFCSYCIVPYVRGRERSRKPEDILAEFRDLVARGYRDITLLGQNVNSYGKGLDEACNFPELLRRLDEVEGDYIIRFMTSHPKDATEDLFRTMAQSRHIAHQLHLPLQAGDDRVLKEMNRRYTAEKYLEKVALARQYMPELVLTTDIIVGFPGETEEEFEKTLELVKKVRYDSMFTFIYSPRHGTPAAVMPDPATRADKQRRFDRLLQAANDISRQKHAGYVGQELEVLIDGTVDSAEQGLSARSRGGRLVHLTGDASLVGQFRRVKITGSSTWTLFGEILD